MLQYIRVDHEEGGDFFDIVFQFSGFGFMMSFKKGELLKGVINGLMVLVKEMIVRSESL